MTLGGRVVTKKCEVGEERERLKQLELDGVERRRVVCPRLLVS